MNDRLLEESELEELFRAILTLETTKECYDFFDDILTINELQAMSQRLQVAKLLKIKKTFNEIIEITGASSATISRVNRCIQHGSGGYELVIDRMNDKNKK